jgi:hypothetical protein
MTRKVWLPIVACALTSLVTACSGSGSDVRQTAFPADTGTSASVVSFDQKATWSCKDADLQAVFAPAFSGDSLVAAIKSAIADPAKVDAEFSFVAPINSFFTSFETNALCLTIAGDTGSAEAASLVSQLRASGNVVSVRRR